MRNLFAVSLPLIFLFCSYSGRASQAQTLINTTAQYDFNIRILPDTHRLEANGTLRLPAANKARTEIRLSLSKVMQDLTVEIIEPVTSIGVAKVESTGQNGETLEWIIRPFRAIPAHRSVLLRFSYAGGEQTASLFYVGPEVSFASAWGADWYPVASAESNRGKGTGTLRFSVPIGQTVYASCNRRSSIDEANKGIFKFEFVHPTYFSFAAGNYTVVRRNGPVPTSLYLLHPRPNMDKYLDGVSSILDVLTKEFGPYPFAEFALIEIPRDLAQTAGFNAASLQGFLFVNSRAFDVNEGDVKYILNFYGHEFGHQWFPHSVGVALQGHGHYMVEALAEYGGLRVVDALAGGDSAEQYRRTGFEYDPIYSALEYFKLVGAGLDHPLSNLSSSLEDHNLVYNKGFLVFDMLSRELGKEKFRRILHGITRRYAFEDMTWEAFLQAIETGAGRDLQWFYRQWFERAGAPDFQLTWTQIGTKVRGVIAQRPPFYQVTLDVEAKNVAGQRIVRTFRVRGAETSFSFPVDFRVQSATLDPHYRVLRWTPEYHSAANAAAPNQK
jgi:hypothetical protein